MASMGRSHGRFDELQQDNTSTEPLPDPSSALPSPNKTQYVALQDLSVDHLQNHLQNGSPLPSVSAPAESALEKLHIQSPKKDGLESILRNRGQSRSYPTRPLIGSDTFAPLPKASEQKHAHFDIPSDPAPVVLEPKSKALEEHPKNTYHALRVSDPFAKEQLAKHRSGQFEWVLTVPVASEASPRSKRQGRSGSGSETVDTSENLKLYFGCNVLHRRIKSGGDAANEDRHANSYTLIATPIDGRGDLLAEAPPVIGEAQTMADSTVRRGETTPKELPTLPLDSASDENRISPKALGSGRDSGLSTHPTPRSPAAMPVLRIEDSFEELDRLEEEFEAVDSIVQVERVPSPDKMQAAGQATSKPVKRTTSTAKKPMTKAATVRAKTTELSRAGSVGKSSSRSPTKPEAQSMSKATPKRPAVARPASLLPPKPLAKSNKPQTRPTFELPGEALARQQKERREARLAQGLPAEAPPAPAPTPKRPKSTREPTRPTFELPGEAISRRKREEHEAKLKAQAEEERRRREFKARPVRNSIAPGSYPRETIASRARQTTKPAGENAEFAGAVGSVGKRDSMAAPSVRSALSSAGPQARGRGATVGSPGTASAASRAASSSTGTGSVGGGTRSSVSAEEAQQQRARGREIYRRDMHGSARSREREQLEREAAARHARREAADRSRTLGREWAEKQKMRLKGLVVGGGVGGGGGGAGSPVGSGGPGSPGAVDVVVR